MERFAKKGVIATRAEVWRRDVDELWDCKPIPRARWSSPWASMTSCRGAHFPKGVAFLTDVGCANGGVTPLAGVGLDAPRPRFTRRLSNKSLKTRTGVLPK